MRAEPVRNAGREIDERAGLDLLRGLADVDLAAALERHVAVRCAVGIRIRPFVQVIRRSAAFLVMHLAGLDCVRRREPAAVEQPHARLGAEAAHAAAARVGQRAQRLTVEEIAGTAGQAGFHRGRRLRRDHLQDLEIRALRVELRRLAGREQHARAFLGGVRFAVELDLAVCGALHHVEQVIILVVAGIEPFALDDGASIDGRGSSSRTGSGCKSFVRARTRPAQPSPCSSR